MQSSLDQLKSYSSWTYIHDLEVALLSEKIGKYLGYDNTDLLYTLGLVHDIGKIKTPKIILEKPGKLNPFEKKIMDKHSDTSRELLMREGYDYLAELAYLHHDYLDGSGVHGIKGNDIPKETRILTGADVYASLIAKRPYKTPKTKKEALHYLTINAGTKFDPEIVEALKHIEGYHAPEQYMPTYRQAA